MSDRPTATSEHALDSLHAKFKTREDMLRLEGKVAGTFDYATRTGERVAVLEKDMASIGKKMDEVLQGNKDVLLKLGGLTERGKWGRGIAIARDLAALFGLGGLGVWAIMQAMERLQ